MKIFPLLLCCFIASPINAQLTLIPQPVKSTLKKGNFIVSRNTVLLITDEGEKASADFLNEYLRVYYGLTPKQVKVANNNYLHFTTRRFIQAPNQEGRYTLNVTPGSVRVEGDSYQGTFYGMQTLIQLLPPQKISTLKLPCVVIEDYPRFRYRGLHLDVGRHFFPVSFIKKYIDYIALHKMNYFHWHLTEDQGWRIEIKKYPKLTQVGACRNGTIIGRYPGKGNDNIRNCGYYTQEQVKEIVSYAANRYITVMPEIEMPGHSSAALASYPELGCTGGPYKVQETWGVFNDVFCAGNDTVFNFLQDVIDEVLELFPSKYIHIGGDECPKTSWKNCPKCQRRIKENNLKDEHELQSYFVQRMEKYINSKGRTIIGWDEILEGGLAPNAIVMSWRGEQGGIEAAKQNHDVIMTPGSHVYFDHSQTKKEDSVTIGGYTTVQKVYGYEPVPKELSASQSSHVLGAQGNVWTEYMSNTKKVEYMIFPRLSALSEVLWSPKDNRSWNDFEKRLRTQFKRYDLWKVNYSRAFFDPKALILPTNNSNNVYNSPKNSNKKMNSISR